MLETRVEKKIVISHDEELDHDQVSQSIITGKIFAKWLGFLHMHLYPKTCDIGMSQVKNLTSFTESASQPHGKIVDPTYLT